MPDHASFLRAIVADPDADAPRLIFADWLEEHGQSAKAFYIRTSVADGRSTVIQEGTEASVDVLLDSQGPLNVVRVLIAPAIPGVSCTLCRGFVEVVHLTLDQFMGPCGRCGGHGAIVARPRGPSGQTVPSGPDCPTCAGSGKLAAVLALSAPLRSVVLVDRDPYPRQSFEWFDVARRHRNDPHPESDLPTELWSLLAGGSVRHHWREYRTQSAALAALSTAACRWARQQARLDSP